VEVVLEHASAPVVVEQETPIADKPVESEQVKKVKEPKVKKGKVVEVVEEVLAAPVADVAAEAVAEAVAESPEAAAESVAEEVTLNDALKSKTKKLKKEKKVAPTLEEMLAAAAAREQALKDLEATIFNKVSANEEVDSAVDEYVRQAQQYTDEQRLARKNSQKSIKALKKDFTKVWNKHLILSARGDKVDKLASVPVAVPEVSDYTPVLAASDLEIEKARLFKQYLEELAAKQVPVQQDQESTSPMMLIYTEFQ